LQLALARGLAHSPDMRALVMLLLIAACRAEGPFGIWKMNPARSTLTGDRIKGFIVRIEPHAKGEVFTIDRTIERRQANESGHSHHTQDGPGGGPKVVFGT
jgi:hypothetical protein